MPTRKRTAGKYGPPTGLAAKHRGVAVPRVEQHTRFFKAKEHLCPKCRTFRVVGKIHCDVCTDLMREDKAATEMRFLARSDFARFIRIVGRVLSNQSF